MNRSEWMGNKFKDSNTGSYDWIPEIITSIDPAPKYPHKALDDSMSKKGLGRRFFAEGIEKIKTGHMQKYMRTEKAGVGRLYAHIKHNEMKNLIRDIKKQEGSLKDEAVSTDKKVERIMRESKEAHFGYVKIDEEFALPYDLGFDNIIKERAD